MNERRIVNSRPASLTSACPPLFDHRQVAAELTRHMCRVAKCVDGDHGQRIGDTLCSGQRRRAAERVADQ